MMCSVSCGSGRRVWWEMIALAADGLGSRLQSCGDSCTCTYFLDLDSDKIESCFSGCPPVCLPCPLHVSSPLGYFYDSHKPATNIQEAWTLVWWVHRFCEKVPSEESRAESHRNTAVTGQCAVSWPPSKVATWTGTHVFSSSALLLSPICSQFIFLLFPLSPLLSSYLYRFYFPGFSMTQPFSLDFLFLSNICNICKSKVPECLEKILCYKC